MRYSEETGFSYNRKLRGISGKLEDLFHFVIGYDFQRGIPGGVSSKDSAANAGDARDLSSVPGLGRSLGVGSDNPLQYSCLENSMDRGA